MYFCSRRSENRFCVYVERDVNAVLCCAVYEDGSMAGSDRCVVLGDGREVELKWE